MRSFWILVFNIGESFGLARLVVASNSHATLNNLSTYLKRCHEVFFGGLIGQILDMDHRASSRLAASGAIFVRGSHGGIRLGFLGGLNGKIATAYRLSTQVLDGLFSRFCSVKNDVSVSSQATRILPPNDM